MCGLLQEFDVHFKTGKNDKISGIWYFYREEDENIKKLRKEFEKSKYSHLDIKFLKKVPVDMIENSMENLIVVWDDFEYELVTSKELQATLYSAATVYCHHKRQWWFVICQSVDVLKKAHKINNSISQATHYVFFRNLTQNKSICRFLNNFSIKLKGGQSLAEVFEKYVQSTIFAYLVICVSPRCKITTAFSNILLNSDGPMLAFHEDDD